jgi:gamma-glutamyltranspeptidase/glutathione hydrolase
MLGRAALSSVVSLALVGCTTVSSVQRSVVGGPQLGKQVDAGEFLGGVAGDEPRSVLIGKQVLAAGGSAADAAAAMGFALAVTLPSRAGLGGGGACLAYAPAKSGPGGGTPEAVLFPAAAPAVTAGDRPAAVPMLALGLFALHARYGVLPIEQIIAPAERMAGFGVPVSHALAQDLSVVGGALLADPAAGAIFGPQGAVWDEGDTLRQLDLSITLARLRVQGVGDLYRGQLAKTLVASTPAAGGPLTASDLQGAALPAQPPLVVTSGHDRVAFLPPPADGGLAAAAAFQTLQAAPTALDEAQARALGVASAWRAGHADAGALLASADVPPSNITALPASTSFVALDRTGGAVACALSMGNLFGTGRVVPGTGILLAASPARVPPPLLAAAIAWNPDQHAFRAEVAGSGQEAASLAVAQGMTKTLAAKSAMPSTVRSPGRINAIACAKDLPGDQDQCSWATDPRNAGLAAGAN